MAEPVATGVQKYLTMIAAYDNEFKSGNPARPRSSSGIVMTPVVRLVTKPPSSIFCGATCRR